MLVVDDDADTRAVLAVALMTYGATVRAAASAREAVVACDRERPDVIVSDLTMPQHDGFDLLQAVRTRRACASVPVIALTAYTPLRRRALEAGFSDFITKPVEPDVLCDRIAQSVRRRPCSSD